MFNIIITLEYYNNAKCNIMSTAQKGLLTHI